MKIDLVMVGIWDDLVKLIKTACNDEVARQQAYHEQGDSSQESFERNYRNRTLLFSLIDISNHRMV